MILFLNIALLAATVALILGVVWYVSSRLRTLFGRTRRWPMRMGVGIVFTASGILMFCGPLFASAPMGLVTVLGGYVFCFIVYLTLVLLVLHAVQLRWRLPEKAAALAGLFLALLVTLAGAVQANHFRVSEIEIPLKGLEKDILVMHLPDIHIGHHRGEDYLRKLVFKTNRLRPDIVLINGDLVDADVALQPGVLAPLADFEAPVYFTSGNHEGYVDTERALERIQAHGVRILHNEVVDTHGIYLVGLDYMKPDEHTFDMHPSEDQRTIKEVLPTLPLKTDQPSVLMHHSPVGVPYMAEKGIDLMLAGHTHAGQMFPGTVLASLFFPYVKGHDQVGDTQVFVSQGAGTFGPRLRLGTKNEIDLIRLKAKP